MSGASTARMNPRLLGFRRRAQHLAHVVVVARIEGRELRQAKGVVWPKNEQSEAPPAGCRLAAVGRDRNVDRRRANAAERVAVGVLRDRDGARIGRA